MTASTVEPRRDEIDALSEPSVIEFGATWCGHCQGAQAIIGEALAAYPQVRHRKVEDGPGRPLGRSFSVKLWPTLIFLKQGKEVARLVRPSDVQLIRDSLQQIV
ncbi:MAG: thioredoxin family protein [Azonexus sp.]|nr:thioredoxin family protein [Azonexus sp.]MDZ4314274.1 thioredoxin family protein [Azonexus sp.]